MGQDFLGSAGQPQGAGEAQGPSDAARSIMRRFHEIEQQMMALSQAFPQAAGELRAASSSLRKAMAKVAQTASAEPQAPPGPG